MRVHKVRNDFKLCRPDPGNHGPAAWLCGPPRVMRNGFCLAPAINKSDALPFVIPRVCDFIIGMTIFLGHSHPHPNMELSSRPERSEVEEHAVLSTSERLLKEARPSPLSSRAQPRDLQFYMPVLEVFFDRVLMRVGLKMCPRLRAWTVLGIGPPPRRAGRRLAVGP